MLETFVMQTQIFQSIHIIAADADFILDFFLNFYLNKWLLVSLIS